MDLNSDTTSILINKPYIDRDTDSRHSHVEQQYNIL